MYLFIRIQNNKRKVLTCIYYSYNSSLPVSAFKILFGDTICEHRFNDNLVYINMLALQNNIIENNSSCLA